MNITLLWRETAVTLQTSKYVKKTRKRYRHDNVRTQFRLAAYLELAREKLPVPDSIELFKTHHILPIFLGGNNCFENLALLDQDLHDYIHKKIDKQIKGMEVGDQRTIALPYLLGKVWCYDR